MKIKYCLPIIALLSVNLFATDPVMQEQEKELQEILKLIQGELKKDDKEADDGGRSEGDEVRPRRIRIQTELPEMARLEGEEGEFNIMGGMVNSYEHVYLLNIPIETKISVSSDLYIHPYRDGLIYKSGSLTSTSPLQENLQTTFCYLKVKESGFIRRFRADDEKQLTVTHNNSTKEVFSDENDDLLQMHQTTLYVDNEHIEFLRCLTTEKNAPLNIGDMNREMGGLLKFKFPEVVDI